MNPIEIIGIVAGAFSTAAPVSQMIKTYRTKQAEDVSVLMFVSFLIGNVLWTIYGFLLNAPSIIIWNVLGMLGNIIAIALKNKYSAEASN